MPPLSVLKDAAQLRDLHIGFCPSFRIADLLPLAEVKSLRRLHKDLPLGEHEEAPALLESSTFEHLSEFDVTDADRLEEQ